MLLLKYLLLAGGAILFMMGVLVVLLDANRTWRLSQSNDFAEPWPAAGALRWGVAARLAVVASLALMPALGIVVVPSGMAGVRVSQISGTLAGTLYPGTHLVVPLIQHVEGADHDGADGRKVLLRQRCPADDADLGSADDAAGESAANEHRREGSGRKPRAIIAQ